MKITVVGTGYVGLVTGACFAEFGVQVACVDNVVSKIAMLQEGQIPIHEPGLHELVNKNLREGRLTFTTDITKAIEQALVIFIAVGTPAGVDGATDLRYIDEVADSIGRCMRDYKVVATKSTVPVGTAKRIKERIQAAQAAPIAFSVVSNPEFLREGSAIEDFMRPNRVVIGADSEQAVAIMKDLYRPLYLLETPFVVTDIPTAEMIKYASNAFLAVKISFINEVATVCERVGADVQIVARGMGLDNRIGSKFLHAGPGFGGSCFPKDLAALVQTGERVGYPLQIAGAAAKVNYEQHLRMVEKIREAAGGLKGKTFGILGLSFKPNTNDMREAPSLTILKEMMKEGAVVKAYDPAAMEETTKLLPGLIACKDTYDVADGADGLVIMTEWNQFRNLDFDRLKKSMRHPLLLDLRNVYDSERVVGMGFHHVSVGRPTRGPSA